MATRDKNIWILMLFLFAGIVVGGLIGEFASGIDFLWWLRLWQRIWTKQSNCTRLKHYFNNIWNTI